MKTFLFLLLAAIVAAMVCESGETYAGVLKSSEIVGYLFALMFEIIIIALCVLSHTTFSGHREKMNNLIGAAVIITIVAASWGKTSNILDKDEISKKDNLKIVSFQEKIDRLKSELKAVNPEIEILKEKIRNEQKIANIWGEGNPINLDRALKRSEKASKELSKVIDLEEKNKAELRIKLEEAENKKQEIIENADTGTKKTDYISIGLLFGIRIVWQITALLLAHALGKLMAIKDENDLLEIEREKTEKEKARADKAEAELKKIEKVKPAISNVIDLKPEIPEKQAIGYKLPAQVKTGKPSEYETLIINAYRESKGDNGKGNLSHVCRVIGKTPGGAQKRPIKAILKKWGEI